MNRVVRPVAVVTAVLFAASCASGTGGDGAEQTRAGEAGAPAVGGVDVDLVAAVDEVVEASTGHFEMTVAYEGMPGMDDAEIMGEGEYDHANAAHRIAVDLGPLLDGLDGLDELGEVSPVEGSFETLTVDGVIYVSSDLFGAMPGVEAEWIRLDPADLGATTDGGGFGLDPLSSGQAVDPRGWLDQLQAVSDLEEVGTEDVRGVPTRHLSGRLRLGDAAATAPAEEGDVASQFGGDLEALADVTVPIDVYVDDDGLIRRVRQRIEYAALAPVLAEAGGDADLAELEGASIETRIDYFDFGAEVDVAAPDDAVDLEELFGGMSGDVLGGFDEAFEAGFDELGSALSGG